jgi:hypothetical protein
MSCRAANQNGGSSDDSVHQCHRRKTHLNMTKLSSPARKWIWPQRRHQKSTWRLTATQQKQSGRLPIVKQTGPRTKNHIWCNTNATTSIMYNDLTTSCTWGSKQSRQWSRISAISAFCNWNGAISGHFGTCRRACHCICRRTCYRICGCTYFSCKKSNLKTTSQGNNMPPLTETVPSGDSLPSANAYYPCKRTMH